MNKYFASVNIKSANILNHRLFARFLQLLTQTKHHHSLNPIIQEIFKTLLLKQLNPKKIRIRLFICQAILNLQIRLPDNVIEEYMAEYINRSQRNMSYQILLALLDFEDRVWAMGVIMKKMNFIKEIIKS